MHVHNHWDHELNLDGYGLGLNNLHSMFDALFCVISIKVYYKEEERVKSIKIPYFSIKNGSQMSLMM